MEIGISTHGSFGTQSAPPSGSGFYNNKQIGMLIDGDGWGTGSAPTTGDFFLPGTPEERYIFAYYVNGTKYEFPIADRMSLSMNNRKTLPKVVDASHGNTLCAVVTGVTVHDVELKITYSFKDTDKAYSTKFEITNKGSYNITDVRFVRSFDPDQDATKYSEYNTYNKVISNPTTSLPGSDTNYAMVVARGGRTKEGFFFIAFDNRARVSRGVEFSLTSAYKSGIWIENTGDPTYATESNLNSLGTNEDSNIAIAFNLGTIYSGGYDSGIYYSSLSPDVNSSLEEVIKPRPPVLSSITGAELPHGYSEGAVSVNASAEAGHELSYQWYKSTSPTNEGGVLIDGATSPSYSLPKGHLAGTEEYYYCVITSTRTDNGLFEVFTTDPITVKYLDGEHDFVTTETKASTCTENGKRIFTCAVCYSSYEETIPGAHEYVSAITKVATAEQDGEITYTCVACGDSYVTVIPARPDSSILLIEDTLPWNGSDNVQLLNSLVRDGYLVGWDAATVAELPMINLSDYSIVYIANDQTTATYDELARFNETLTAFVMSGGTVIYGACDEGWSAGHLTSALPGGVMSDNYYSNHNYIVDTEHDVITGTLTDGNALTNALLYGNYCSHTSFVKETLPEGARILIEDAHGNPTLVEYNLGAGTVIATGLTWEFYYNRPAYDSSMNTTYSKTVFDDLIVYAIHSSNPCDHAFSEDAIECYPTCTEKGFMAYECTKCGILKKDAFIDALGHTEGEWQVVEDASEIAPGKKVLNCLTCGEVIKTQLIPMIGAPVVRVEAEKDSVALGEQIKFTLNIEDGVVVDKLVLSFDFDKYVFELTDVSWLVDGDVSVDSTTGEITLTLSEPRVLSGVLEFSLRAKTMAESFNVNIKTSMSLGDAAIGTTVLGEDLKVNPCTHTNATFKFVNFAYHGVVCKTCGATSLSAHEYSEAYVYLVSPANCMSGDVYAYGCACGDHGDYTFTVGEPTGHVFGEYVYDNNATYTEDGTSTATCPGRGLKDTIVIEGTALGLVRKYLDMVGIALAEDRGMTDKYEAIVAAIQTYELLSEEEKLEVETAHERLYDAIAAYNEQAVVVNKEHVEATEFALTVFSGSFALLPALLWFVKKRFMI